MRTKMLRKTLLMAGIVLAIVGATSLPASAHVQSVHLDFYGSGSITINGTTVPIPNTGSAGACDVAGHSFLNPDIDDSSYPGSPATIDLDVADYNLVAGTLNISGTDYRVQILGYADTAGAIDSSGNVAVGIDAKVVVSSCNGSSTLCTVNHINGNLTASGYSGSMHPVDDDSIDGLSGTSAAISSFAVGCNSVIRAFFNGQTAAINVNLCVQNDSYPHADSC